MIIQGYEVPNTIDTLTVEQFDTLNTLEMDSELSSLERWLKKFVYLGVPEEVFDDYDLKQMTETVKEFNDGFNMNPDKTLEVEIDGFKYVARESISAKDMSMIEKIWNKDRSSFALESVAIMYKREDLTRTEHYTKAHIDHKKELFKSQPCKLAIPYLNEILKTVTESTEEFVSE